MQWQEIISKNSDDQHQTSVMRNGKIEKAIVTLSSIGSSADKQFLYVIRNDKAIAETLDLDLKENASDHTVFNYEDASLNPIQYFDESGTIIYANDATINSRLGKPEVNNVNDIFLDSDLGSMTQSISECTDKSQLIVKTVMKGGEGFIPGFALLSKYDHIDETLPYRIEFIPGELLDQADSHLDSEESDDNPDELDTVISMQNEASTGGFSYSDIITVSPAYKKIINQCVQVADTNTPVLITGETGTGKELLTNFIFKMSDREDQVMVKVNCAALPKTLIESVLFGHEKGSFTGADERQIGKFESANGGTIFLDEIGELPLDLQPKLLRALQEGEIERIGNPTPIKVDVRLITATNRDLVKMVNDGTFRSDLYYRICVFPIENMPLRERREDILPLAKFFLNKANIRTGRDVNSIRSKDIALLKQYNYPGNVRELENIIERAVVLAKDNFANLDFILDYFNNQSDTNKVYTLDSVITSHIINALEICNGKVTGNNSAAELLGIHGKTLASKLKKYSINPNAYKKL